MARSRALGWPAEPASGAPARSAGAGRRGPRTGGRPARPSPRGAPAPVRRGAAARPPARARHRAARRRRSRGAPRTAAARRARPPSHAVPAQPARPVGELGLALHEEARLADELAGLLREHPRRAVDAVLGIRRLLLLVLLLLGNDEALLQDDVEARLDVIVVELVLVLVDDLLGLGDGRGARERAVDGVEQARVVLVDVGDVIGAELVLLDEVFLVEELVLEVLEVGLGVELGVELAVHLARHQTPSHVRLCDPGGVRPGPLSAVTIRQVDNDATGAKIPDPAPDHAQRAGGPRVPLVPSDRRCRRALRRLRSGRSLLGSLGPALRNCPAGTTRSADGAPLDGCPGAGRSIDDRVVPARQGPLAQGAAPPDRRRASTRTSASSRPSGASSWSTKRIARAIPRCPATSPMRRCISRAIRR